MISNKFISLNCFALINNIPAFNSSRFKYIPSKEIKTPIVEGCSKYYECKVVFKQEMNLDNMPEDMKNSFYGEGETKHIFYYGEILAQY